MSEPVLDKAAPLVHPHHVELGFWRIYVFSLDHKMGNQPVQDRIIIGIRAGGG